MLSQNNETVASFDIVSYEIAKSNFTTCFSLYVPQNGSTWHVPEMGSAELQPKHNFKKCTSASIFIRLIPYCAEGNNESNIFGIGLVFESGDLNMLDRRRSVGAYE